MGARRHHANDITRGKVSAFASTGMTQENIAKQLAIGLSTLRRHYLKELETAQELRVSEVANSLYKVAMSDSNAMPKVVAAIFLLKTQGRWRESSIVEHTNSDGSPMGATKIGSVQVYLPDNGRDPGLLPNKPVPMKLIEGRLAPLKISPAPVSIEASP